MPSHKASFSPCLLAAYANNAALGHVYGLYVVKCQFLRCEIPTQTHTHAHTRSCYQNGKCRTCSLCHNRRGILCLGVNVHLLLLPLSLFAASMVLASSACCMWSIGVVFPTFRVGHVYGHLFMEFGYCMHLLLLLSFLLPPPVLH